MPDNLVYIWHNMQWVKSSTPPHNPDSRNFIIICNAGDWSGYRSLADCLKQIMPDKNLYYYIVER